MPREFSPLLAAYRSLESAMLVLYEWKADQLSERVRDVMDTIWHQLPPADREWINSRYTDTER